MIYVHTTLEVPGAGTVTHIAELEEIDSLTCRMHRLLVMQGEPMVADIPNPVVPHPDTYHAYEGLEAHRIDPQHFQVLWAQATS